jgi:hypothetical protein
VEGATVGNKVTRGRSGDVGAGSAFEAARQTLRSRAGVAGLSPEETSLLMGQLTTLLERAHRVRALGPAYAGIDVSRDVRQLLARLEVGSSLASGVH